MTPAEIAQAEASFRQLIAHYFQTAKDAPIMPTDVSVIIHCYNYSHKQDEISIEFDVKVGKSYGQPEVGQMKADALSKAFPIALKRRMENEGYEIKPMVLALPAPERDWGVYADEHEGGSHGDPQPFAEPNTDEIPF